MNFLTKRIIIYAIVFLFVMNLAFVLPRLLPGNAAQIQAAGVEAYSGNSAVQAIEARLGLNKPVYVQYGIFLKGLFLTWPPNMGVSYTYYPVTVTDLVAQRMPWTMLLILSSLAISLAAIFLVAGYTATRRGSIIETLAQYLSITVGDSVPIFWTGMIFLWVFGVSFRWFPVFGNVGSNITSSSGYFGSVVWHAILPIITLSIVIFGEHYLLLRGSIQKVLQSDYVLAAKGRGLKERLIANRYILKNSILPFVSVFSFSIAKIIGLVILIEKVFGYPGLGDLIVDSITQRDYPVLQGSLFYFTLIVIVGGLIGDIIMVRMDPRLRR